MLLLFVHSKYTISDKKEDKNMKNEEITEITVTAGTALAA